MIIAALGAAAPAAASAATTGSALGRPPPQAANNLTGVGTNLLGLSVNASGELGNQAEKAREFDTQQQNMLGGGLFGMLSGGLGNIGSGGSFLEDLGQFGLGALGI